VRRITYMSVNMKQNGHSAPMPLIERGAALPRTRPARPASRPAANGPLQGLNGGRLGSECGSKRARRRQGGGMVDISPVRPRNATQNQASGLIVGQKRSLDAFDTLSRTDTLWRYNFGRRGQLTYRAYRAYGMASTEAN
jgi:hypothetical protein